MQGRTGEKTNKCNLSVTAPFRRRQDFLTDQQDLGWHGSDACCVPIRPPAAVVLQNNII